MKPSQAGVDATVCQQLFSELLGRARIRFESGRATIDQDSKGLLDRLIETALRCPTANIEVAGHTDSDGDNAANKTLSEKRAQAVAEYLVLAGLPTDRLKAVGYGSTQPLAPNDSEENKAKNRRIDFVVSADAPKPPEPVVAPPNKPASEPAKNRPQDSAKDAPKPGSPK